LGTATHAAQAATLRDYLHVARRRKWIILAALVAAPLAAVALSLHQQKLYEASAEVFLSSKDLAAQLTGTQSTGINLDPTRIAQTQADLARVPLLAQRVLHAVPGTGLTPSQFLAASSATATTDADLLTFQVTNHHPVRAERLVNAYAAAYTSYRRELDTSSIAKALAGVNRRIDALQAAGDEKSPLYASLVDRQQTLVTMEALQTSNASVVKRADSVVQTQPKTTRNAVLGVALGILLGIALAFLWEALDTRVRSAEEISEQLGGLPLLARLPAPNKKLRSANRLVMLDDPGVFDAESFRVLRTNLEFVRLDRNVQTIMITSALEQEGKSTTAANLAVALARGGHRVVLVDLDLRRPFIHRFFGIDGPGVTQVALGHTSLEEALVPIAITDGAAGRATGTNGNGNGNGHGARVRGLLEVLPAGPIPPDPGEFVATQSLEDVLAALRERGDIVLVDAPPTLNLGDTAALSTRVDGIVVATRMRVVRRHMLHELSRQLSTFPTPVLGFVVTDADGESGYGSVYGYGYSRQREERAQVELLG
jgi:Mrp family chromosome partitioning ATPase/capsular polysaccharide biosynthesis protein